MLCAFIFDHSYGVFLEPTPQSSPLLILNVEISTTYLYYVALFAIMYKIDTGAVMVACGIVFVSYSETETEKEA